jgi:hypothetical protein
MFVSKVGGNLRAGDREGIATLGMTTDQEVLVWVYVELELC